jgi:hypothetical protein
MIGIVLLTPRISSTSCFFGDWIGVVWIWAGLCNCGVVGNAEPERHGLHGAPVKPAVPLVRAGMQDRLVVAVAIDEVDGVIGLWREAQVPHQRPAGKLALDPHGEGIAVARRVEDRAGTDVGDDLLGRDLDPDGDRIGAVALAENVLRIISAEREIARRKSRTGTGRYGERNCDVDKNPFDDCEHECPRGFHQSTAARSCAPAAASGRNVANVARPANRYVMTGAFRYISDTAPASSKSIARHGPALQPRLLGCEAFVASEAGTSTSVEATPTSRRPWNTT